MHITLEQLHVLSIKRLQNTYVGNPRYKLTCTDEKATSSQPQQRTILCLPMRSIQAGKAATFTRH